MIIFIFLTNSINKKIVSIKQSYVLNLCNFPNFTLFNIECNSPLQTSLAAEAKCMSSQFDARLALFTQPFISELHSPSRFSTFQFADNIDPSLHSIYVQALFIIILPTGVWNRYIYKLLTKGKSRQQLAINELNSYFISEAMQY